MKRRNFTMVELLAVIAIIAILIGITIPSVGYARKRASITQTKADIAAIVTAVKAYEGKYNLLPIETTDAPATGDDNGTVITPSDYQAGSNDTINKKYNLLFKILGNLELSDSSSSLIKSSNPRRIKFLEIPQGENVLLDAFAPGKAYTIIFNSRYNSDGVTFNGETLRGSVFVYSYGPDGEDNDGTGDDITSWAKE